APLAVDFRADELPAARFGQHPGTSAERRIVPDVLPVSAVQFGDPGARFGGILPEAADAALHGNGQARLPDREALTAAALRRQRGDHLARFLDADAALLLRPEPQGHRVRWS